MRVGIDVSCLRVPGSGNTTYMHNLIKALSSIDNVNSYYLFCPKAAKISRELRLNSNFRFVELPASWAPARVGIALPLQLFRIPLDILHCLYVLPPVGFPRSVVTIHDISFELFPSFFPLVERIRSSLLFRWSVRRANKIITISEHSKRDICQIYGIEPDRVTVTYLAADERYKRLNRQECGRHVTTRWGIEPPFILFVGNVTARKNLGRLLEAYEFLRSRSTMRHRLVIVGRRVAPVGDVFRKTQTLNLERDVFFLGYVPITELPILYNAAELFVFPSLYEGFGLPILEAMACGLPVVASNSSSFPEIVGDAALMVDPYDVDALARAIDRLIIDVNLRAELSERAFEHSQRFSWRQTATQTLQVFEELYLGG